LLTAITLPIDKKVRVSLTALKSSAWHSNGGKTGEAGRLASEHQTANSVNHTQKCFSCLSNVSRQTIACL